MRRLPLGVIEVHVTFVYSKTKRLWKDPCDEPKVATRRPTPAIAIALRDRCACVQISCVRVHVRAPRINTRILMHRLRAL